MLKDGSTITVQGIGSRSRYDSRYLQESLSRRLGRVGWIEVIWSRRGNTERDHATRGLYASAWAVQRPRRQDTGENYFYKVTARYGRSMAQATCSVRCSRWDEVLQFQRSLDENGADRYPLVEEDTREWTCALEIASLRQQDLSGWFSTLTDREQRLLLLEPLLFHEDLPTKLRPVDLVRVLATGDARLRERAVRLVGMLRP